MEATGSRSFCTFAVTIMWNRIVLCRLEEARKMTDTTAVAATDAPPVEGAQSDFIPLAPSEENTDEALEEKKRRLLCLNCLLSYHFLLIFSYFQFF